MENGVPGFGEICFAVLSGIGQRRVTAFKDDMMNESQGRDVDLVSDADGEVGRNGRRYLSPNRVLARSFRISRDGWKSKHQAVQEKLEQQRQLSAERGRSRDQWKEKYEAAIARAEAAEVLAQQRLEELEQARAQMAKSVAEVKKKAAKNRMTSHRSVVRRPSV